MKPQSGGPNYLRRDWAAPLGFGIRRQTTPGALPRAGLGLARSAEKQNKIRMALMKPPQSLLCAFCASLWLAFAASAAEPIDLILVAGQSNAVGYDAKPSELPSSDLDHKVMFWWRTGDPPPDDHDATSGGEWKRLRPQPLGDPKQPRYGKTRQYGNFAQKDGGFGPEIGLARTLLLERPGTRLAIVKAAFSGTGIRRDWDPKSDGDNGSCYRALISETRAAIKAAEALGLKLRLRAFTWVQGESDANKNDADHYENALRDMIASLRKDLDAPDLIALLAVNTRFGGGKNAFLPRIVEAQQAVGAADPRCAYVDTAKATIANNVHYDAAGTLFVGGLFAKELLRLEAGR